MLHFGETFAPVARLEATRILLAYASHHEMKLYQMDVKSAFLNGFINELVYVDQPSSSSVPQDGEKDERVENEDTHISHEQMLVQAQDVDPPQSPPQVVNKRNTPLLQDHPQDLIIGSPSKGVMTRSQNFIYCSSLFCLLL